jgi:vacuolar-type H+-ATPase subunit I/STV1
MADSFDQATSAAGLPGGFEGTPEPTEPQSVGQEPGGQVAAEPEYEIKWNGRTERLPLSRLQEFAQKGYDYTQKMQQLASERGGWQSEKQQYEAAINEIKAFLQDSAKLEAYVNELKGIQQVPQPDDVMTAQQVQRLLQMQQQQLAGYTQAQIQEMRQAMEVQQLASSYTSQLDAHIDSLKTNYPELAAIPRIDEVLRKDVADMGPRDIEEAKAMMVEVAKQHQASVKNYLMAQRKQAAVPGTPNPVLQRGIEPPGGSGPMPHAAAVFKSVKDPNFKAQVMQDFLKAVGQGGG